MSDVACVDGDGWISDDSDFYGTSNHAPTRPATDLRSGSKRIRAALEEKAMRALDLPPKSHVRSVLADRVKQQSAGFESIAAAPLTASSTDGSTASETSDVLGFLKPRPQIAERRTAALRSKDRVTESAVHRSGEEPGAEKAAGSDPRARNSAWWQEDESIVDFLRRAPVATDSTACLGPWLWVQNPNRQLHEVERSDEKNVDAFMKAAQELLDAHLVTKAKIEAANEGKAGGTISRYLSPYREKLEDDLLRLAVDTHITRGKWMLFPSVKDVTRVWRLVAEATSQGKLGPTSKVATHDPAQSKDERVICVYTYDFSDEQDVRRVLNELVSLGLVTKPIYFKCDAYTYLGLNSQNEYKIRASLYSSKEMLEKTAKAT